MRRFELICWGVASAPRVRCPIYDAHTCAPIDIGNFLFLPCFARRDVISFSPPFVLTCAFECGSGAARRRRAQSGARHNSFRGLRLFDRPEARTFLQCRKIHEPYTSVWLTWFVGEVAVADRGRLTSPQAHVFRSFSRASTWSQAWGGKRARGSFPSAQNCRVYAHNRSHVLLFTCGVTAFRVCPLIHWPTPLPPPYTCTYIPVAAAPHYIVRACLPPRL